MLELKLIVLLALCRNLTPSMTGDGFLLAADCCTTMMINVPATKSVANKSGAKNVRNPSQDRGKNVCSVLTVPFRLIMWEMAGALVETSVKMGLLV